MDIDFPEYRNILPDTVAQCIAESQGNLWTDLVDEDLRFFSFALDRV
jgi:hypothetical protein